MSFHRRTFVVGFCLVSLLLAACGGGGSGDGGTGAGDRLAVLSFSHDGRNDTYRDQLLRIELTAAVRRESITPAAVVVLSGDQLRTPVPGAFIRGGDHGLPGGRDVLWFDPTRTQATVDRFPRKKALDAIPMDRPFGLNEQAQHRLAISGPASGYALEDRARRPILDGYIGEFTTGSRYTPEDVPPEFIGFDGTGDLAFVPPRAMDGLVEYDADIVLEFDEPIHPATMELGSTVHVRNLDVLDHLGHPIPIPGTFTPSTDGRTWTFKPSFHYGTGPYRIEVALTTRIEDRAGNPLLRPADLTFVTRENPDVATVHSLLEEFDTNAYADTTVTTAEWNTTSAGELTGGDITTTIVTVAYSPVPGISNQILVDFPLVSSLATGACPNAWKNGARVMMSYTQSDIGVAGAITQIYWGPAQNALFAATHDNIKIRIGHGKSASLGSNFDKNWVGGQAPSPAYDGVYVVPQDADVNIAPGTNTAVTNHWGWPKLTTPFEYDGQSPLLVDIACDAASDCQTLRAWFHGTGPGGTGYPGVRALVGDTKDATSHFSQDAGYPYGYPMVYDAAFVIRRRRTFARSRYYDSAQPNPDWADPILSPASQTGGATYVLEWQGAPGMEDPNVPGKVIANEAEASPWSSDIDIADGHRFVRFRVTMIANLNSETVPRFRRIEMPYSFRKE